MALYRSRALQGCDLFGLKCLRCGKNDVNIFFKGRLFNNIMALDSCKDSVEKHVNIVI